MVNPLAARDGGTSRKRRPPPDQRHPTGTTRLHHQGDRNAPDRALTKPPRPGRQPETGAAATVSTAPGSADLVDRRHLDEMVSWTGRERLRCLWYRLRLTVAEMNYATRRVVEVQAPWMTGDRPTEPASKRAALAAGSPPCSPTPPASDGEHPPLSIASQPPPWPPPHIRPWRSRKPARRSPSAGHPPGCRHAPPAVELAVTIQEGDPS